MRPPDPKIYRWNHAVTRTVFGQFWAFTSAAFVMPLPSGAGSVRPSIRSPKYPLSTCTWVLWSIQPTVTIFWSVCPSVHLDRFGHFPENACIAGMCREPDLTPVETPIARSPQSRPPFGLAWLTLPTCRSGQLGSALFAVAHLSRQPHMGGCQED